MNSSPISPVLICLHGWGGSKESFTELREALKNEPITILTPDLPGFGSEPEPKEPWNTDDYADWTQRWITSQLLAMSYEPSAKIFLLGHSHGGRIALKLAARQSTNDFSRFTFHFSQIFLCAAAGIRHPRHIKRIIGLTLAKSGKALLAVPLLNTLQPIGKKLLYKLVRVHDYEDASPVMRETLIRVSREDLRTLLPTISVPTDIFWGTDDRMTPYSDGLFMKKHLPTSVLHTYPGIRHAVHRERAQEIAEVIWSRIAIA